MTEQKKSKNPFINAANAAKAVANAGVPGSRTTPVQNAKFKNQVNTNKPTTRSAGRGR